MVGKIKYGKIAVVIFITVLIWVWTDLALDEESDKPAVIVVDESANPKLWVSFDESARADVRITLSGPHAAIIALDRRLREQGKSLEFVFDAAQENMDEPGSYTLKLLPVLQRDTQIKRLGLKVKSCEPQILNVNVVELVARSLPVECFDESGNLIRADSISIEPSKVDMFVPEDRRTARVQLTRSQIDQARLSAVNKFPYVVLAAGQVLKAATPVKITMPPEPDPLSDYNVTATLGIALSPNLQGKYEPVVTNLAQVISSIAIRATEDAKRAYEGQPYPSMTLYILDDDAKKAGEEQRRVVLYNFPLEFVRKGEIQLKGEPAEARFTLNPVSSETP